MFFVLEIQKPKEGNAAYLMHTADTAQQAESVYHQVLAAAAISNVYVHSAVIITDEGMTLSAESYKHEEEAET